MAEQSKLPRGGKKYRRIPKQRERYKLQFGLTDRNKKRRLRRHLREHPLDRSAISVWTERGYGNLPDVSPHRARRMA